MRGFQYNQAVGGTCVALFVGALAWGGLQYVQSLLRRAGMLHTPSLGNVNIIMDLVQWMVVVLMVGAIGILWVRRPRWDFGAARQEVRDIRHLNLYQVCELVAEAFRYQGWKIHNNAGGEAEDGPDLILQKDATQNFVWCRFWRLPVTEEMVKEVITWGKTYRAPSKIISLRAPTAAAKALAEENNIEWIGRDQILEWKRSVAH